MLSVSSSLLLYRSPLCQSNCFTLLLSGGFTARPDFGEIVRGGGEIFWGDAGMISLSSDVPMSVPNTRYYRYKSFEENYRILTRNINF